MSIVATISSLSQGGGNGLEPQRGTMITRSLEYTEPYDWPLTLRMIGAHTVPGAEELDHAAGRYARLLPTPAGPVKITVAIDDPPRVLIDSDDPEVAAVLLRRLRHWLDLDHDPQRLAVLHGDPTVGPELRRRPGLRRIGYPGAFEAVILTILGQQVSLAAGRTFAGRLTATYGESGPGGLRQFPTAERLAEAPVAELRAAVGVTGARAGFLSAAARAFVEQPDLVTPGPLSAKQIEEAAARLLALPGVGPWTAAYLRMRLLGDPDAWPAGDLVLRRALQNRSPQEITALAEAWRPWRSYAVVALWTSAGAGNPLG
jgi:AraC family transcriptional regulator, regulatory protein of adaptative response / DNA-3-methyladenine glycosylase II